MVKPSLTGGVRTVGAGVGVGSSVIGGSAGAGASTVGSGVVGSGVVGSGVGVGDAVGLELSDGLGEVVVLDEQALRLRAASARTARAREVF